MQTPKFRIVPEALAEIDRAFQWYRAKSQSAARGFLAQVDEGFDAIVEFPKLWPEVPSRPGSGARHYVLKKYPYDIIYLVVEDLVRVVAIAHHKQRPGYWADR